VCFECLTFLSRYLITFPDYHVRYNECRLGHWNKCLFVFVFVFYIYFRVIWVIEVVLDQQLNSGLLCETAHLISPAWFKVSASDCDIMYCIFCSLLIPVVESLMVKVGAKCFLSAKINMQMPQNFIFTANSINYNIFENQ